VKPSAAQSAKKEASTDGKKVCALPRKRRRRIEDKQQNRKYSMGEGPSSLGGKKAGVGGDISPFEKGGAGNVRRQHQRNQKFFRGGLLPA